jgi:tape measure domain-containing protein
MEGGDLRMSSIDQRVVQVMFDNKQFEVGIAQSRDSLGRFTKGLQLTGATKGLNDVSTAANGMKLDGLANGIDSIANRFKTMSVIGITALTNITNKIVDAGIQLAKSFVIDPIKDGFNNYETQINATQTILANTAAAGTKLKDVTKVLGQLNTYANQTVYNFSDMTKNIGTFTAAGVGLKDSVSSIKGIANLAAMSGSTSEQASTAMYQLSQAIAAGSVKLQDWNSVVNAGLGGKTFQTALENTARASGVAIDKIIKKQGGFRNSLQKGWLTSDILTKTLSQFTGDLSLKQIEAMGYTKKQAEQVMALGKVAVDSATKIKTMSQLTQALKEEVGTAYAAIFKTIFGDIGQATDLFTNIHNVAETALTAPIYALNTLLQGWDKLGGRKVLIQGLADAFKVLSSVMKIIGSAFREIFPPTTAKQLYDMTVSFRDFIERLKLGGTTANELKRTFAGAFAVLGIGWDIVKAIGKELFTLFSVVGQGSGSVLKTSASVGDFLVKLKQTIEQGKFLNKFFAEFNKIVAIPIALLRQLGTYLGSLFDKFDGSKAEKSLDGVAKKLTPVAELGKLAQTAWSKLLGALGALGKYLDPFVKKIADLGKKMASSLQGGLSGLNFDTVLNTINTVLFGGIVLLLKRFVDKFHGGGSGPLTGLTHAITESFDELSGTLKTMQGTLKAATLLEIAAAVGILTLSVMELSKIDQAGLVRSSVAITVMFTQLTTAMAIFSRFIGTAGFAKMPFLMGSLILLAAAVDILASAVRKLAALNWNSLSKGLTGLSVILGSLVATMRLMGNPEGMIAAGLGMIALAKAVDILVKAVTSLGGQSWETLGKGLAGVAGLLVSLALFTKFAAADKAGALQGLGIILLATGIKILASSMKTFASFSWTQIAKSLILLGGALGIIAVALMLIPPTSVLSAAAVLIVAASLGLIGEALAKMGSMSWMTIAKGLVSLAGALVIISAALILIPPTSVLSAVAILVVAASLGMIADALAKMGGMSWGAIAKSLVELAVSLGVIAVAMILMTEALPGAAALLVVAGALLVLLPVLQAFGNMSWGDIAKSLLMLAGVFVILGLAGLVLGALTPVLIALGIAVVLLGGGMLLAGAGVFLFAAGLTALSVAGAAGAAAIVGIVTALLGLIPTVMKEIGLGIVAFAKTISTAGPAITSAITVVIEALIDAIAKLIPKVVLTMLKLLTMLLQALATYVPKMVVAGLNLITGVLNGIASKLPGVINAAANVVVAFLNGISAAIPKVIQAAVNLVLNFINSLAAAIRKNSPAVGLAGANLGKAIVEGMITGLASGIGSIQSAATNVAKSAIDAAKKALNINSPSKEFIKIGQSVNEGFYKGLTTGNYKDVDKAFQNLRDQLANTINSNDQQMVNLENKLAKLESARHKNRSEISATKQALAQLNSEHAKEVAAYAEVTKGLNKQHAALDAVDKKYQAVTASLNNANTALANAIKTRDDYNKQITDQFNTLPTIATGETVATYDASLADQIEKTKEFANVLQRLRRFGLGDVAYKELLSQGISALPFAQQLLDGGKASIGQINNLDSQLATAASALGKTASTDLYQAAVNSAQGLVDGLKHQQAALEKQMEILADAMVNAIKKKLGIKSPSTVFAEVGGYSAQGIAQGLTEMSGIVEDAAGGVGKKAVAALSKSLAGLSDMVTTNVNINPTITPVLDLSGVKKDAAQIGTMLGAQSLSVQSAYSKAVNASAGYMSNASAIAAATSVTQTATKTATPMAVFNQYNTSPTALSAADIYRQTKNQLSQARGIYVFQDGSP